MSKMGFFRKDDAKVIGSIELTMALNVSCTLLSSSTLYKLLRKARNSAIEKEGYVMIFLRIRDDKITQADVRNFVLKGLKEVVTDMKKTLLKFSDYLPAPFTKSEIYEICHYDENKYQIKCEFIDPVSTLVSRNKNLSDEIQSLKSIISIYEKMPIYAAHKIVEIPDSNRFEKKSIGCRFPKN